jgi:aarF domain-containing kinase
MRPWKKPKSKEEQEAEDEAKRLDNQHAINKQKEMIKGFLEHVELVPNELIFVSRSMRIIQASNQALHSPVNRINILARHAASALISTEETPTFYRALIPKKNTAGQQVELSHRLNIWFHSRTSYFTFRTTLLILDFAFVGSAFVKAFSKGWVVVKQSVLHGPWSQQAYIAWAAKTGGLEDDLEAGMRKMAKDEFGIELQDDAFIG